MGIEHLKPWKKGQSGNPSGKRKNLLTNSMVEAITQKMLLKNREELQEVISNPKATMLEINIASILIKGAKTGDQNKLESQLQRAVGKVIDKVETNTKPYIVEFLDGKKLALGSAAEGDVIDAEEDKSE